MNRRGGLLLTVGIIILLGIGVGSTAGASEKSERGGRNEFEIGGLSSQLMQSDPDDIDRELSRLADELRYLADQVEPGIAESIGLPLLTALLAGGAALLGSWISNRGALRVAKAQHAAEARRVLLDQLDTHLADLLEGISSTADASMSLVESSRNGDAGPERDSLRSSLVQLELRRARVYPWLVPAASLDSFSEHVTVLLKDPTAQSLVELGDFTASVSDEIGAASDRLIRLRDAGIVASIQGETRIGVN